MNPREDNLAVYCDNQNYYVQNIILNQRQDAQAVAPKNRAGEFTGYSVENFYAGPCARANEAHVDEFPPWLTQAIFCIHRQFWRQIKEYCRCTTCVLKLWATLGKFAEDGYTSKFIYSGQNGFPKGGLGTRQDAISQVNLLHPFSKYLSSVSFSQLNIVHQILYRLLQHLVLFLTLHHPLEHVDDSVISLCERHLTIVFPRKEKKTPGACASNRFYGSKYALAINHIVAFKGVYEHLHLRGESLLATTLTSQKLLK